MEETIISLLCDICEDDAVGQNRDMDLISAGLLDSLGRVELLVGIEEQLGAELVLTEINWNECNTPNKIIEYVREKMPV